MTKYLIVDGYNIINYWPNLKAINAESLEDARDKLIELLQNYSVYKGYKTIVVFDAHLVKGSMEVHEQYKGVEVVYTKENETADAYIERLVDELGKLHYVVVATSDWLEQQVVLGRGAARISARELYSDVQRAQKLIEQKISLRRSVDKHTIENRISAEIVEKLEKIRRQL